jgi:hypothetical protein
MAQPCLSFEQQTTADAVSAAEVSESARGMAERKPIAMAERPAVRDEADASEADLASLDCDPLDRSTDRLLAKLGLIEDAAPQSIGMSALAIRSSVPVTAGLTILISPPWTLNGGQHLP